MIGFASSGVRLASLAYPDIVRATFLTAKPWTMFAVGSFNLFAIAATIYFMFDKRRRSVARGG